MKTKYLIAILACATALFVVGQVEPQPVRELTVSVLPTNTLAATSIRVTIADVTLHPTTGKPLLTLVVEAWGSETEDGITNRMIISKKALTLTTQQLNSWNQATNGFAFLKAAILNKVKLLEAP